jgi:hypothetical protein
MNTQTGMTIKDIVEISNVSESTVRNWIASAETAGLSAKTAEAQETKVPARFTLDEVITIIRAGGRATLADLLADNAVRAASLPAPASPKAGNDALIDLISIVKRQSETIDGMQKELDSLRHKESTRTIALLPDRSEDDGEWINTTQLAQLYGKSRATTLSHARAMGWTMRAARLENGSLTYEFHVSALPLKLQEGWKKMKEASHA